MPCAACKFQRRKCTPECIFVPYFPAEQPWKFAGVHQVYGTSNVAKLLRGISPEQREYAVASLVYEAEARLMDPVHGSVAHISSLQQKLRDVALELAEAKEELAAFDHLMPPHHDSLPCLIQPPEASPAVMDIGKVPQMQPMFDGTAGGGQMQPMFDGTAGGGLMQPMFDATAGCGQMEPLLDATDGCGQMQPLFDATVGCSQMQPMFDGLDGGGQMQPLFDCAPTDNELAWISSFMDNLFVEV